MESLDSVKLELDHCGGCPAGVLARPGESIFRLLGLILRVVSIKGRGYLSRH
jgi:hypothetical protein